MAVCHQMCVCVCLCPQGRCSLFLVCDLLLSHEQSSLQFSVSPSERIATRNGDFVLVGLHMGLLGRTKVRVQVAGELCVYLDMYLVCGASSLSLTPNLSWFASNGGGSPGGESATMERYITALCVASMAS